ncbi:hypothetical protein K469DRAFT_620125 [Zopfia rhizophila CBS 207.26]|uniref:AA1-like domain-containing protein n=1 Tax=Zopfia rhizophila CBS 207.26 TaxID=1314779 RepID=A0A6A6EMZ1_9PEZI|nr:hypothetical protein K469DRAFT_620125 [Zopfia rhizophila CBS 207.26]
MLFTTLLFATLALASPTRPFSPRQTTSDTVFKVTNFSAFMANPNVEGAQSNMTFHVVDSRPKLYAEVDCVVPNTYFNLYAISALFEYCGDRSLDFMYRYTEGELTVRRGWKVDDQNYFRGSGSQGTYWKEDGPEANVTTFPDGKLYTRKSEWLFPVTRLTSSSPPRPA